MDLTLNKDEIELNRLLIGRLFLTLDRCELCVTKEFEFYIQDDSEFTQKIQNLCSKLNIQITERDIRRHEEVDDRT